MEIFGFLIILGIMLNYPILSGIAIGMLLLLSLMTLFYKERIWL